MPNVGDLTVGGIYPVVSAQLENLHQLSSKGPGELYSLTIANCSGTASFMIVLLDNNASVIGNGVPGPGQVLDFFFSVGVSGGTAITTVSYAPVPLAFKTGLWIVGSTILNNPYQITVPITNQLAFSAQLQNG